MKPRFLVDAQLPPALADQLSAQGYDAEHVARAGLRAASDKEIWAYAQKSKMVLISKDEDFASAAWQSRKGPQVLWVRIGNSTNRVLRQAFQDVLPEICRRSKRASA